MATNFDRIGSEIQVNETILNGQTDPDVAVATDGRFLVAFDESFTDSGSDHDIYLQFVNANGTRSGSEVHVATSGGVQFEPAVASRQGGGAAVVWHDDAAGDSIRLQVVNSDGSLSGSALTVSDTLAPLAHPDAAMLANGQVVVAFESNFAADDNDIVLRVLNADGTTFATPDVVTVDKSIDTFDALPAIAASGNNALIVYERGDVGGGILARLFTGTVGGLITLANGSLQFADVAALTDGRYIVTWIDNDSDEVQARFVGANGDPLGSVFTIAKSADESRQSVAALPDGGFIVTWHTDRVVIGPENGASLAVLAQRFDASGKAAGDLFLVNSGDASTDQDLPAIAVNPVTGRAFIAWQDGHAFAGADDDPNGIRGHAFQVNTDIVNGTVKADLIKTFSLGERINGRSGNDKIFSFGGNDVVHGNVGNDLIAGGLGNDILFGDAGNDTLNGGIGNDFLAGGIGRDILIGGAGKDRFDFNSRLDSGKGANSDVIKDFHHGEHDRIDLVDIDANTKIAGNNAFHFIRAQSFHDLAGELRFAGHVLQGDVNGDGVADFAIIVAATSQLTAADFFL